MLGYFSRRKTQFQSLLTQEGKEVPVPYTSYRFVGTMPKGTCLDQPSQVQIHLLGTFLLGERRAAQKGNFQSVTLLESIAWRQDREFSFLLRYGNETESLASFYRLGQHQPQCETLWISLESRIGELTPAKRTVV